MSRCKEYCGVSCIDGSCPVANIDEYIERDYPVIRDCSECHYYKGCEDCYFAGRRKDDQLRCEREDIKDGQNEI